MDYLIISGIQIAISEDIKLMKALDLSLLNLGDELLFQSDNMQVLKRIFGQNKLDIIPILFYIIILLIYPYRGP